MPPDQLNPWLGVLVMALFAASVATWIVLAQRARQGPLLPYEPRRPVPWGAFGPALLIVFVLTRVVAVAMGDEQPPLDIEQIAYGVVSQFVLFGSFFAAIAVISRASLRDIGLPDDAGQFFRDVRIGFMGWLAAIVPVYGLQALLVSTSDDPTIHPLIEIMLDKPSGLVLGLAFMSAVILAPLCEEIAFRLLLQGWLEKFEDELLRWRHVPSPSTDAVATENGGTAEPVLPPAETVQPPSRGLFGLPYGWAPILVSAALFAAAHVGQGPAPVALFVLAMGLGYIYQRTHRILPCIVLHMLLNLTTLVMLGLQIWLGEGKLP